MQYKLLALDMDGTTLNSNLMISERNQRAIRLAAEQGVIVTLSSGRMFCSAIQYAQQLGINVPLITYNGGLIQCSDTNEVLFHLPVPLEAARKALKLAKEHQMYVQIYIDDELCVETVNDDSKAYANFVRVKLHAVGDLLIFMDRPPTKIMFIDDIERLAEFRKVLEAKLLGEVFITKSKPRFLELMHPEVSKGTALAFLAEHFGIKQSEVVAIGDNYNDLAMIEYAGLGVAMGNAPPDVQERADYVTRHEDEDGVAEAIERFILGEVRG